MRTVGDVISEARILLNDPTPSGAGSTLSGTATSLLVGDAITEARGYLNDTVAPYRYPEADLYTYFGNAMLHLRRRRPDLFQTGESTALPRYSPSDAATPFPLDENYYPAFVQYIVGVAEVRDDTTQQDQKATMLAQGFMQNIQTGPFRYADAWLYSAFNEAMDEVRRLRPDLFHGQLRNAPFYATVDNANLPFPIEGRYFLPTVDFVAGRARARNYDLMSNPPPPPPETDKGGDYRSQFAQRLRAV